MAFIVPNGHCSDLSGTASLHKPASVCPFKTQGHDQTLYWLIAVFVVGPAHCGGASSDCVGHAVAIKAEPSNDVSKRAPSLALSAS